MVGNTLTVLVAVEATDRRKRIVDALVPEHDVRAAGTGDAALTRLDDAVDLAVLERALPGPDGVAVARHGRAADAHVVLVDDRENAVGPAVDWIDEWRRPPLTEADLESLVETVLAERVYGRSIERLYVLTAKLARLETTRPAEELAESEYYRRLEWLVDEQRAEVDIALSCGAPDWATVFEQCVRDRSTPA